MLHASFFSIIRVSNTKVGNYLIARSDFTFQVRVFCEQIDDFTEEVDDFA
jgi:hypothetical protein